MRSSCCILALVSAAVDRPGGGHAAQRDLHKLEEWAHVNLMMFNKARSKVLHLGRGNPWYQYRLHVERIESRSAKKEWGVLVDEKLDMTRQCALAAGRPAISWAASKTAWPAGQGRGFCPSAPQMRHRLEYCIQLWGAQYKKDRTCWSGSGGGPQK